MGLVHTGRDERDNEVVRKTGGMHHTGDGNEGVRSIECGTSGELFGAGSFGFHGRWACNLLTS